MTENEELVTENVSPSFLPCTKFPDSVVDSHTGNVSMIVDNSQNTTSVERIPESSHPNDFVTIPDSYTVDKLEDSRLVGRELGEKFKKSDGSPLSPCELDNVNLSDLTREYTPDENAQSEIPSRGFTEDVASNLDKDDLQGNDENFKENRVHNCDINEGIELENNLNGGDKEGEINIDEHGETEHLNVVHRIESITEEEAVLKSKENPAAFSDTARPKDTPQDVRKKCIPARSRMKRPSYKREPNVPCKLCTARLKDSESLFEHVKIKHGQIDKVHTYLDEIKESLKTQCKICCKFYSRKEQLAVHINTVHKPTTSVKCQDCNLTVKSQRHLQDHIRRIHKNKDRIHLCHLCPASFKVPSYLADHLKYVHTTNSDDAYKCESCGKSYKTEKYLRNHVMRVHGTKKYICHYCKKSFPTHNNLARHVTLLHEKKGVKPFQCGICERRFTLKANLKDHINTLHYNSYSLKCSLCNLGFRRKKDLHTHEAHSHGSSARKVSIGVKRLHSETDREMTVLPFQTTTQTLLELEDTSQSQGVEGSGVQYIVATPEILQAFGLQMTPDFHPDKSIDPVENQTFDILPQEEDLSDKATVMTTVDEKDAFSIS